MTIVEGGIAELSAFPTPGSFSVISPSVGDARMVLFTSEEGGVYSVSCPSLPGCHSQGATFEEALVNIGEAIELYLKVLLEQSLNDATEVAKRQGASTTGRRIHNLEEFVELWGAVLRRVNKKLGVSAVAYLHDATPVGLDEKEAVLEFRKEFHFAKACEAATRLPFEQVINECLATPHTLCFRLASNPDNPTIVGAHRS